MSYYSNPPARFAGMDPMTAAKAAAIEREERRERMEQASEDIGVVRRYLGRLAAELDRDADQAKSVRLALHWLTWREKLLEAGSIIVGLRGVIIERGFTLADAARDAALERSESDAEAVPDTDGGA